MPLLTAKQVRARLDRHGLTNDQKQEIALLISELSTEITNLNAWATALATKLNADGGVTDTNYDTNPQA